MTINLILGDCLDEMKKLPGGSVDAIITDPPYNIGGAVKIKDTRGPEARYIGTDFAHFENIIWPADWLPECVRVLKDRGILIAFYGDRVFDTMIAPVREHLKIVQIGVWHKTNPPPAMRGVGYQFATELFVIARKGSGHYFNKTMGQHHNVLEYPICNGHERTKHPTQKPLKLIEELLLRFTEPGAHVLDPFMGSGTTGAAALKHGRDFTGIEKDPGYFAICQERLSKIQYDLAIAAVTAREVA